MIFNAEFTNKSSQRYLKQLINEGGSCLEKHKFYVYLMYVQKNKINGEMEDSSVFPSLVIY